MKLAPVRSFALSLPETSQRPHHEMSSFRVRGKIFVTVPPGGELLHVFVDDDLTRAAVGHDPAAYEELWWGKRLYGVRVRLAAAKQDMLLDLIEEAWRRKAPKELIEEYEAASVTSG